MSRKRNYTTAMGYENEHPDIQESNLEEKYRHIPNFNSPEFSDSKKLLEWLSGYNEYYSSKYSISLLPEIPAKKT